MNTGAAEPIRAEVSIYPLRQEALAPAIEAALAAIRGAGVEAVVGTMSTHVLAEPSALFAALERAFEAASARGDVVMTVHVSNACRG